MMRARVVRRAAAAQVVDVCRMRIGIVTTSTMEWYRTRPRSLPNVLLVCGMQQSERDRSTKRKRRLRRAF